MNAPVRDLFIFYADPDRPAAEWAASVLENADVTCLLRPTADAGPDWQLARHSLCLITVEWLADNQQYVEWLASWHAPSAGGTSELFLVRLEDVDLPSGLAARGSIDLFGLDRFHAERLLVDRVCRPVLAGRRGH